MQKKTAIGIAAIVAIIVAVLLAFFLIQSKSSASAESSTAQSKSSLVQSKSTSEEAKDSSVKEKSTSIEESSAKQTAAPTKTPTATPTAKKTVTKLENLEKKEAGSVLSKDEIDSDHLEKYFKSYEISDEIFKRIYGDEKSFKTYCTVAREDLRYIKLLHWGFDEKIHVGELIVNKAVAEDILEIFQELYKQKYQIEKMFLVDNYNADDSASIAANNTSAFNYRTVTDNAEVLSNHAMGFAIDINPINNPYVWYDEDGNLTYEDPDADLYLDREAENAASRHMINHEDLCYTLFIQHGWQWGGDWSGPIDYQHFEKTDVNYSY